MSGRIAHIQLNVKHVLKKDEIKIIMEKIQKQFTREVENIRND